MHYNHDMLELKIQFFGRVQGVNFRRTIVKIAEHLNLTGYVENLDDGSVACIAQGEEKKLQEFLNKCQNSKFPIKLTGLKYEWLDKLSFPYKSFTIKRDENILVDEAQSFINLGKEIFRTDEMNIPNHVVIIPDGNRRWAREKGWKAYVGHREGSKLERLLEMLQHSKHYGIKYLTFWAFSTENWSRDKEEVDQIFKILRDAFPKVKQILVKEKIRFRHLGRTDRIPADIVTQLKEVEEATKNFTELNFQFCLDYNGRDDIVRAVNKIIEGGVKTVDEETLSKYLDTGIGIPDPDLIIRTAGEKRTSGIMAYQAAYAEFYFTDIYYPDFDKDHFQRALLDYSARTRRKGGTSKKDLSKIDESKLIDPLT